MRPLHHVASFIVLFVNLCFAATKQCPLFEIEREGALASLRSGRIGTGSRLASLYNANVPWKQDECKRGPRMPKLRLNYD